MNFFLQDDASSYKKTYQKYMSQEAKMGPVPASFTIHLIVVCCGSLFIPWLLIVLVLLVVFFSYLSKQGMYASEFWRFLRFRLFGLVKPMVFHLNNMVQR